MFSSMMPAVLPAASITDTVTELFGDIEQVLLAAAAAIVVFIVVKNVWQSGGAVGATVMAVLVAGFLLFAINNLDFFEEMFEDELGALPGPGRGATVLALDEASPPPGVGEGRSGVVVAG